MPENFLLGLYKLLLSVGNLCEILNSYLILHLFTIVDIKVHKCMKNQGLGLFGKEKASVEQRKKFWY